MKPKKTDYIIDKNGTIFPKDDKTFKALLSKAIELTLNNRTSLGLSKHGEPTHFIQSNGKQLPVPKEIFEMMKNGEAESGEQIFSERRRAAIAENEVQTIKSQVSKINANQKKSREAGREQRKRNKKFKQDLVIEYLLKSNQMDEFLKIKNSDGGQAWVNDHLNNPKKDKDGKPITPPLQKFYEDKIPLAAKRTVDLPYGGSWYFNLKQNILSGEVIVPPKE